MNDSKAFATEKYCPSMSDNWHFYTIGQYVGISSRSLSCQLLSQPVLPSQWGTVTLTQFWSLLSCVYFLRLNIFSIQRKTIIKLLIIEQLEIVKTIVKLLIIEQGEMTEWRRPVRQSFAGLLFEHEATMDG